MRDEDSPVIVLPDDETKVAQLREKLDEYRSRLDPERSPRAQMGTICKITVLETLLEDESVNTHDLSLEMHEEFGSDFRVFSFNNACGVIEDYCETGGENVSGGTGFPSS